MRQSRPRAAGSAVLLLGCALLVWIVGASNVDSLGSGVLWAPVAPSALCLGVAFAILRAQRRGGSVRLGWLWAIAPAVALALVVAFLVAVAGH